jgi:phosphate transport system permease protein
MTTTVPFRPADDTREAQAKRRITAVPGTGDRVFRGLTRTSGLVVLGIFGAIGVFLTIQAWPAIRTAKFSFLTTQAWEPDVHHFGIAGILPDTIFIALVAVIIAIPISLGLSLFISEVAPQRIKRVLVSLVDLMAAVPSVVYGLWAFFFLQGRTVGIARWLSTWLGWIPIFHVNGSNPTNPSESSSLYTASTFVAGIAVSLMVIPILTSVMRESFSQAPLGEREGAYALGATRWGMIRSVVLPFGKGGIIGGTMLGLGRALGETIVVLLIISPVFTINTHILQSGGNSVSFLIANLVSESSKFGISALMAAGLALFAMTLIINFSASAVVARSRSGAESDG